MRYFICLLLFSVFALGQDKESNLKDGFIAKGYDVVAYFNNNALEGKKGFTATYKNVKYKFSNQKNLDTFKKEPQKYVPQYGGWCAYAIGTNNSKVDINPKTFEVKNDKLYLFYNAWGINTLKKWQNENPKKLKIQADKNWNHQ